MAGELSQGQSSYSKLQKLASVSMFRSIKVYPERVVFDGQEVHETIVLFLRQHPVVLIPEIFRAIMMFIFGFIIYLVFSILTPNTGIALGAVSFVILTFGILIALNSLFFAFLKWYFTVFIITNTRVVDIDFLSLFDASLSSTTLGDIQDATHATPGFFSTLFDMGTLTIQTAAEKERFEIDNIPRPRDVQDVLMDLIENVKKNDSGL